MTRTLGILLATMILPHSLLAADGAPRPNVVLMMADDLGYADLSCYGSRLIRTPHLDRLAADGVRLTSFYAGCTICTPSRMALLTGCYPPRVGWNGGVVGYGIKPRNGLSPQAITLAEAFREAGYRTGLVGKWHLGDTQPLSPQNQGFQSALFINKSNNQTKQLWQGDTIVADPFNNRRLTERFADEAIRFVKAHREEPFLLYVPFSAPHFPAEAHPDWDGRSKNKAYGDVVEELDSRVGDILTAIEECGLREQTIVVFLSDNGVEPGQRRWARADPFRGLKWSTLEGGNRVPCLIRWPARIPAGQVSDAVVAAIDLFPTMTAACEISAKAVPQVPIDGVNVLPTLVGDVHKHPRDTLLYWHGWGTLQAIRQGDWKLYVDEVKELPESRKGPYLVNLSTDPREQHDLSREHPERVRSMLAEARKQVREIRQHSLPPGGPPDESKKPPKPARWLDSEKTLRRSGE